MLAGTHVGLLWCGTLGYMSRRGQYARRRIAIYFAAGFLPGLLVSAIAYRLSRTPQTQPASGPPPAQAARVTPRPPEPEPASTRTPSVRAIDPGPQEQAPAEAPTEDGCGQIPSHRGTRVLADPFALNTELWLTHIPPGYDPDVRHPIVFLLHQTNEAPETLLHYTGLTRLADRDRWLIVAPRSSTHPPWQRNGARDLRRILRATTELLCVDTTRVYVIGHGAGGRAALEASCEPWVTAIATSSFRRAVGEVFCDEETAKAHIMLSPMHSPREPFDGGAACWGSDGVVDSTKNVESIWRRTNGCRGRAKVTKKSGRSTCRTWNCKTPFESCHLDGGHPWAGAPQRLILSSDCDGTAPDFPSGLQVWSFFRTIKPLSDEDAL